MIELKLLKQQQGYLLLVSVILIMIIGFMGVAISYMLSGSSSATIQLQLADQAFYIAESGLEEASRYYLSKSIACGSITGNVDLTNATVGNGKFTVTGTLYTGATTLSSAITNTSTTITVNSTTGFAPSGFLMIDKEAMTYAAISGNNFIGVMRGYDNTTAANHAINADVSQNQCVLDSTAGVPSLSSPKAKRELIKNISPPTFYAVGDVSGGIETILYYNGNTWVPISPSVSGNADLESVHLSSATTGWAVGQTTNFYRLNGASWSVFASGLTNANPYNGVFCSSPTVCQVVGASRRAGRWAGASWTQNNPTGGAGTINAVNCDSNTSCWAVGTSQGNSFFQGTGSPISWTAVVVGALGAYPFNSIFCNSATDCWAVGANATFARKNGATWSSSTTGMPNVRYNGIYCTSSSNCWAVGNAQGNIDILVRWNGTSWT